MNTFLVPLVALCLLGSSLLGVEPIPQRVWTSKAGTTLEASALKMTPGKVHLKAADGRLLEVPLDQLVDADQKVLLEHFPDPKFEVPDFEPPAGLSQPTGQVIASVAADDTSHYHLYIPKSIAADTPAPFLFFNGAGGMNPKAVEQYIKASELTGMVITGSEENSNRRDHNLIVNSTAACIQHINQTLPVAKNRMFFTGGSGGGARTFLFADKYSEDCAGAMPYIGYIPDGAGIARNTCFYVIGGARDFNRYASAIAAKRYGKMASYRPYRGGHAPPPPEDDVFTEGIIWLYTKHLYEKMEGASPEKARFEARFLNYLITDLKDKPWQAYFWTDHLLNTCKLSGLAAGPFESLRKKLAEDSKNVAYLEGLRDLEKLAMDEYQIQGGTKRGHTTDSITRKAERLAEKYAGIPEIEKIATEMGQATD